MNDRGKVIVFEGMDFSGKTTIISEVSKRLKSEHILIREPGQTELGKILRENLLNEKKKSQLDSSDVQVSSDVDALLFALDRLYTYETVTSPAIDKGINVISDRSIVTSLIYQEDVNAVLSHNYRFVKNCMPDLVILLDVDEKTAKERSASKGEIDRMERMIFKDFEKYRNRYLEFDFEGAGLEILKLNNYMSLEEKINTILQKLEKSLHIK